MKALQRWLDDQGMTQVEFAELLKVSQPTVSDWLSGNQRPSLLNLMRIRQQTGLSSDDLLADLDAA